MRAPEQKPVVKLIGNNAYGIMGAVKRKLRAAGADQEYINQYLQESMSGDYDNLLVTTMKYATVE